MVRYSVIKEKNPREIALLRGSGCVYKLCTFCDYHLDRSDDERDNFLLNSEVLSHVTGEFGEIELINSGSVFELDKDTVELIKKVCREKQIKTIHFESHYLFKNKIPALRREFGEFTLKMKIGLETFDYDFREKIMKKGIREREPEIIAQGFDEANFLFGLTGQTESSMRKDIELGLKYFERICINVMCDNTTDVKPDKAVIEIFANKIYPQIKDNARIDILMENTDFGVGL